MQARFVLQGAELLEQADRLPKGPERGERMWFALQAILTAAANIQKALWSGAQEPTRAMQIAERKPIRDALGISDASCLSSSKVRNSLEHFDDRFTRWYEKALANPAPGQSIVAVRVTTKGPKAAEVPGNAPVHSFVVYDRGSGTITFGSHTAPIPDIVAECRRIVASADAARDALN
jgi:hypothetical protein